MAIQEKTRVAPTATAQHTAEWTARDLHPVARWVLVPGDGGTARLEMVWSVPNPSASDAL